MSDEDKGEAKRAKKAKEKQEKKEKDEAIKVFVNSVSLDDVIWDDDESKSILIGKSAQGEKKTKLQSIKGKHPKNLPVPVLKKLCTHFQIGGYKNADKADMCELILKAAKTKNLKHQMYPSGNANTTNTNADGKKKSKKKGKKKSKATKPKCVTKEGTYYHAILTLFAQDLRPYVIQLGHQPSKNQLDKRSLLHGDIYDKMVLAHNNADRRDLAVLSSRDDFYATCNVETNVPSEFDVLTAEDMSEIIDFLNFHFKARMAKCKLSGNHDRFANFVRDRPYLFLYWELQQDGPIEIQNMAIPELPDGARRNSSNPSSNKASANRKPRDGGGKKKDPLAAALNAATQQRQTAAANCHATSQAALELQQQKHAVEQDRSLSSLLLDDDSKRLFEARDRLKSLRTESDYDSDSSEAMEAKEMVLLWKKKYRETHDALSNHSSIGNAAAKAPPAATRPAAASKETKAANGYRIAIDQSSDSSSSKSSLSTSDSDSSNDNNLYKTTFKTSAKENVGNGSGTSISPEKKRARTLAEEKLDEDEDQDPE